MDFKNKISQRSCSAVQTRAAGRNYTGSLNSFSSIRQSVTVTDILQDILSKDISNPKSRPISRNSYKCKTENGMILSNDEDIGSCSTIDDDLSNYVIQELSCKLQELNSELHKEKNNSQILKRDVLVAKKVIETEIASNTQDFETLLQKADSRSWKGRQEIILLLKQKLRYLKEIADSLNNGTTSVWRRSKPKPKMEDLTQIVTDDRKVYWCLELERREVWKNAERYRQEFVTSRDLMKNNLERLTIKIERLKKEAQIIQKKLSITPKQIDEDLIQRLYDMKKQLKSKLEEKSDERRKINISEQEICRNSVIKEELLISLAKQRRIVKEKAEMMKVLKDEKSKLEAVSEDAKKVKRKQASIRHKKLEDMENDFGKIIVKSEDLIKQIAVNKGRLEKKKKLLLSKSSISLVRKCFSTCLTKITKQQVNFHCGEDIDSKLSSEIPSYWTDMYGKKLSMYQSIFYALGERNEDKIRNLIVLINDTKEWYLELVENRCLMWELTSDIKMLKSQNRKLKKSILCSTKQKLVKKKNSSQQVLEILSERRMSLAIKVKENKCLKLLIRHVLANKEDDYKMLQSYYMRNKDVFLKQLTHLKL